MSNPMKTLAVVAAIVASVALWFVFESLNLGEMGDRLMKESDQKERASGDRLWNRYVTVEQLDRDLEAWPGKLECDSWESWESFTREKSLLVGEGVVAYDNGEVQAFIDSTQGGTVVPAELEARFEWWRGEVQNQRVTLEGWYTAVNDRLKRLEMTGKLSEGELYLTGTRGPRDCVIQARRPVDDEGS